MGGGGGGGGGDIPVSRCTGSLNIGLFHLMSDPPPQMTGLSRGYKNLAVQGGVSHFVVVQRVKEPCP